MVDQVTHIPTILIFDSGIGGISVYNEIRQKIPNAQYIYLFDNKYFPYGDKSSDFLIQRVKQIISDISHHFTIDIAVIACNTASTICLPSLRATFSFPIVGVVPAIKPATQKTHNNCIGLLATKATISGTYTKDLINQFAQGIDVKLLGLSELAIIAEQKLQGEAVNMQQLKLLLTPWLLLPIVPDTIVLGCTHYPFIKDELQSLFPTTVFIDSGYAIAERVAMLLKDKHDGERFLNNKKPQNIISSTRYNQQVENLIQNLYKYNFNKYQQINFSDD